VLGDLILQMDETPIVGSNSLLDALETHKVGDVVTLTIFRNNQKLKVKAKLQDWKNEQ